MAVDGHRRTGGWLDDIRRKSNIVNKRWNGTHEAKHGAAKEKLWWNCVNARRKWKMQVAGSRHAASQVCLRAPSPAQRSLMRINYLSSSTAVSLRRQRQSGQAVFLTVDSGAELKVCHAEWKQAGRFVGHISRASERVWCDIIRTQSCFQNNNAWK